MLRLKVISGHLSHSCTSESKRDLVRSQCGSAVSPDDVVVVHGLRTAITKAKRGAFKVSLPGLKGAAGRPATLPRDQGGEATTDPAGIEPSWSL